MKISIITATYNSISSLPSTLKSLREQTHNDIEWIVVDGGSKDGTIEFLDKNIRVNDKYVTEPDKGIYDALNKGIKMASGDIIGFVHSDDFLASDSILGKINKVFEEEQIDGVYGDLQYVDKNNVQKVIRYWKSQPFRKGLLRQGWMPAHPTLFLKREVYEKYGNFNLKYKISADYDLMLRIFINSDLKFKYISYVITKMRLGGASNKNLNNILIKSREDFSSLKSNHINYPHIALFLKNFNKIKQFVKK